MKHLLPSLLRSITSLKWGAVIAVLLSSWTAAAQAANDDCASAETVPVTALCSTPVSGTLQGATPSLPPTANCGSGTTALDVWYRFVATGATQTITLTAGFSAVVDVRSGTCASSSSVFCANATGAGQTVTALTSGQTYFVRVYAGFQAVDPTFTLCLTPGPSRPVNDDCATALSVPVTTSCATPVSGNYATATQSLSPSGGCGFATTARDVWYTFVATGVSQTITVNGNLGTAVEVRSGTCGNTTSVFCANTFGGTGVVATGLTNGQAYYLRLYPNTNAQPTPANGAFTLCIQPGPPPSANDDCATAVGVSVVQSCVNSTNGTVSGATQSLPSTANCGGSISPAADVWYSFVAAASTQLITLTPRFEAVLEVRAGTCGNTTSLLCTAVFANSTTGTVAGGLTSGQTYYVRVYANGQSQPEPANATFTFCITATPTPPPANDECAAAVVVPVTPACTAPTSGTVEGASQSLPATTNCGVGNAVAQDVWYRFVASGASQLITLAPRFLAVLDVRTGTCASSTSVFCSVVAASPAGTATVVGGLSSGQAYFVRVYAGSSQQPPPLNATFTLCINPGATAPANDECTGAVALAVSATCAPINGTVAAATQSLPVTSNCGLGVQRANDVWYSFVATGTAHSVTLLAPQFAALLDVRTGTCGSSASVFCTNNFGSQPQPAVFGGLVVGQTYFLRVYTSDPVPPVGPAAAFNLCVTTVIPPPANDDCAGALPVPVQLGTTCGSQTSADNSAATRTTGVPLPTCADFEGADLWFQVTVPTGGALAVRTVVPATGVDVGNTGMSLYAGACNGLTQIGCDDDSGGGFKSLLSLSGRTPGEVLYIRVWAVGARQRGIIAVCATVPLAPPANDEPCGAITLPLTTTGTSPGPTTGTNVGATTSTLPGLLLPVCSPATTPADVWYAFTPISSNLMLALLGNAAGLVRVFTAPSCSAGPFNLVFCASSGTSNSGFTSPVNVTGLTGGTRYYVAVSGYDNAHTAGSFSLMASTTVTATRDQAASSALVVFPNPSNSGQFTMQMRPLPSASEAVLYDATGREVLRQAVPGGATAQTLRTAGLTVGIYTLRVIAGDAVLTRKVVLAE